MKCILTLIAVLLSSATRAEMDESVRVEATMAECDKGIVCACPDSPALELSVVKTCGEYIPMDKVYAQCHDRVFKVPDRGSVNPTPLGGLGQRHFAA
jgi:hypothetical protein